MAELNCPNIPELLQLLHDLVNWELVAVHLRGMTNDDIEKIKKETSLEIVEERKRLCFSKWLSMCPDPSWDDVVTALEKGNEKQLAQKVWKEKLSTVLNTQSNPVVVKLQENEEKIIDDKLEKIHESYTLLFRDVRKKITEDQLREITRDMSDANIDRLTNLKECKTVDELTEVLREKGSFLDGSVLNSFVKFGLPESNAKTELLTRTKDHMQQAKEFICEEPLKSLKGKLRDEKGDIHSHLIIKVNEEWDRVKLSHVEKLIQRLADVDNLAANMIEVKRGCIEITFFISENKMSLFQLITKQKQQFIRLVGMLYLQVGENPPIFQEDENKNYTFENGFLEAAQIGHVQAIEFILSIGINIDYLNNEGKTALILASEHGHSEAVKLILSAGASVDMQDKIGRTAVMVAKTVDIYQTLVQANANTNIVTHRGSTPLMISCLHGNHDVANYLLFTLKHNITTRPDGLTLLMAASEGGNDKIVEYLLNNEHDPDIQDNYGRTAIQISCFNRHYTVTEILLNYKADPSIPDNNGWTPLMSASQEGHGKIVKLLLQKGVDPNTANNKNGRTALMQASKNGHNKTVELLLSNEADPNIKDKDGKTAIQLSLNRHHKIANTLLKHNTGSSITSNSDRSCGITFNNRTSWEMMRAFQEKNKKAKPSQKAAYPNVASNIQFGTDSNLISSPPLERGHETRIKNRIVTNYYAFPRNEEETAATIRELDKLHHSFNTIFDSVVYMLKTYELQNDFWFLYLITNIMISTAHHFSELYLHAERITVKDVIEVLQNHCSFLDGSYLNLIVRFTTEYLQETKNEELIVRTEEHMERAKKFRKRTPIEHLKDQINERILGTESSLQILTVKLNEIWGQVAIDHVMNLIKCLVMDDELSAKLIRVVGRGSIVVEFLIRQDDFNIWISTTSERIKFFRLVGILNLQFGENPPIFEEENTSYTFENGLLEASKTGHVQAIKFILSIGINVDYQNNEGKTALILASQHGHSEAVELLLRAHST